ncbi:MAG: hypothetical protein LBH98_07725 [Chitinispirillales bacterium]|jgi:hypothetical protein|nr:hypothetical protein [Chitinispirillales bacterium]
MGKVFKVLAAIAIVAQMVVGQTQNNVQYIDGNGTMQTANNVTAIDPWNIETIDNLNGWYLVRGKLNRINTFIVSGTAHVILEDNCNLTVTGSNGNAGINVSNGKSLTIYAQSTSTSIGKLTTSGNGGGAGIGGGINGVNVGTITINGGAVIATGSTHSNGGSGGSAGIGGGSNNGGSRGDYGGYNGGSAGNGGEGGNITINGGTITAKGGSGRQHNSYNDGYGMGGGNGGNGGNGAGIGGGGGSGGGGGGQGLSMSDGFGNGGNGGNGSNGGNGGNITINGGTVMVTNGIGGGSGGSKGNAGGGGVQFVFDGNQYNWIYASDGSAGTNGNDGGSGSFILNGNGVVFADSVGDNNVNRRTGGILFIKNFGEIYGKNITLTTNVSIPANHNLAIPAGATLTISADVTLTIASSAMVKNDGTINGCGKIVGKILDNQPEWNCNDTPIHDIKKSDGKYGIKLANTIVSDKAEMKVVLPNSEKVAEAKIVIYDNIGNVVFETLAKDGKATWNLTNSAGIQVANGTYLIIVEAKGNSGKTYKYSTKLGIKR